MKRFSFLVAFLFLFSLTACMKVPQTPQSTDDAHIPISEMSYDMDSWKTLILDSCLSFSDGCNTCNRQSGSSQAACTRKFCQEYEKPKCLDKEV
ncbi:MAG: hypothetical protein P1V18_05435 [Candidatus Gracilibacteria bacterium]|nr:hypothetical protein [Candidatus Gracilibacteria bacterium]